MAGTLDLVQRRYAGAFVLDGKLHFAPRLPEELDRVAFAMQFRGTPLHVVITHDAVKVSVHAEGVTRPVRVHCAGDARQLRAGESCTFDLTGSSTHARPAPR